MNKKILFISIMLVSSLAMGDSIPEWYKRDIEKIITGAYGVILYKTERITHESTFGLYHTYRIDSKTVSILKGAAPEGQCYMIQSEGEWKRPDQIGENRIVILKTKLMVDCGVIEPGYSAPGTNEYVELFESIIKGNT